MVVLDNMPLMATAVAAAGALFTNPEQRMFWGGKHIRSWLVLAVVVVQQDIATLMVAAIMGRIRLLSDWLLSEVEVAVLLNQQQHQKMQGAMEVVVVAPMLQVVATMVEWARLAKDFQEAVRRREEQVAAAQVVAQAAAVVRVA